MYSDNEGNVTCKAVSFIQHSLIELVRNAQPAASARATKQFFASLSREHNVLGIGQLEEAKSTCLVLLPSIGLPAFADISTVFNIAVRVRCCRGFHEATAISVSMETSWFCYDWHRRISCQALRSAHTTICHEECAHEENIQRFGVGWSHHHLSLLLWGFWWELQTLGFHSSITDNWVSL